MLNRLFGNNFYLLKKPSVVFFIDSLILLLSCSVLKKITAKEIAWSSVTGIVSSILFILCSPTMFELCGLAKTDAIISMDNPGIISIPLAVIMLVVLSLLTQKDNSTKTDVQ